MGNAGSSIPGAWPTLESESQDIICFNFYCSVFKPLCSNAAAMSVEVWLCFSLLDTSELFLKALWERRWHRTDQWLKDKGWDRKFKILFKWGQNLASRSVAIYWKNLTKKKGHWREIKAFTCCRWMFTIVVFLHLNNNKVLLGRKLHKLLKSHGILIHTIFANDLPTH